MTDVNAREPRLESYLKLILRRVRHDASRREAPTLESARHWHIAIQPHLRAANPDCVGTYRGDAGLRHVEIILGGRPVVAPSRVAAELTRFEESLQGAVRRLDELLPPDVPPNADQLAAVLQLCAWAHAQWVRIHPFAEGNARIARLWANSLAMRYGLPPFMRLHAQSATAYEAACAAATEGDWQPTESVMRQLLVEVLAGADSRRQPMQ